MLADIVRATCTNITADPDMVIHRFTAQVSLPRWCLVYLDLNKERWCTGRFAVALGDGLRDLDLLIL